MMQHIKTVMPPLPQMSVQALLLLSNKTIKVAKSPRLT